MIVKLKNKEPRTIINAFQEIFVLQANPNYPIKAILIDNGGEFKNQLMTEFCAERSCCQIFGLSHSPKSNALVEQTNGLIRRLLSFLFTENGSTKWVDSIDKVANSWYVYDEEQKRIRDDYITGKIIF
jgi:IS30 family transposase